MLLSKLFLLLLCTSLLTRHQLRLSALHPLLCICLLLGRHSKHHLQISKYNNKVLSEQQRTAMSSPTTLYLCHSSLFSLTASLQYSPYSCLLVFSPNYLAEERGSPLYHPPTPLYSPATERPWWIISRFSSLLCLVFLKLIIVQKAQLKEQPTG